MSTLGVTLYADDGAVCLGMDTDEGEWAAAMTPDVADDLADRLKAAAAEARKQKPESVQ